MASPAGKLSPWSKILPVPLILLNECPVVVLISKRPLTVIISLIFVFELMVTVFPLIITTSSRVDVGDVEGVKCPGLLGNAPEGSRVQVSQLSQSPDVSEYHVLSVVSSAITKYAVPAGVIPVKLYLLRSETT